ncbi:uncharacterized protein [Temnothorax longispinosus]|uniref:uncharacterized protein isoform X2 n=1 Tax=Temnothorax longispinosus TaxID=300112 RepID=UPI003A98F6BA
MEYIRKVSNDTAAAAAESFILCIYCGHLPTKHVSVFEKKVEDTSNAAFMVSPMPQFVDCSTPTSIASSSTIAAGSDLECDLYTSDLLDISNNSPASSVISKIKTASASVSAGIDFPDAASNRMSMPSLITVQNEQESLYIQQSKSSNCEKPLLNVHEDDENSFPLPKFSKTIQPLLLGTVATNQEQKELSYQMKTELVHHIRVNNLLKVPTSEKQDVYNKKMYRLLGSTLTKKYPHMLWDTPSTRSKKTKNTQIWSTFVHHVSMRLKQRRNREKKTKLRLETLSETTEVAEEENLSVEDAQKELKLLSSMFSQTVDHTSLYSRLRVLLQKTATERVECSQLPSYFLVQEGLSIELEIRSKNEISKVEDAVDTCINKYFQTERNGEKNGERFGKRRQRISLYL